MLVVESGLGIVVVAVRRRPRQVRQLAGVLELVVAVMVQGQVQADAERCETRRHPQRQDEGREQTMGWPVHGMDSPRFAAAASKGDRRVLEDRRHLDTRTVDDTDLRQSIAKRLLGFGTVVVISEDRTHPAMRSFGVQRARAIQELIRSTAYEVSQGRLFMREA